MLTLVNTEVYGEDEDDKYTITTYSCDFIAECDGTSLWANTEGHRVHVTGIEVRDIAENEDAGISAHKDITVTHDSDWEIYTDKGFERAISAALGYNVQFTEQGMQDDNYASMELA